ncbi:MAG: chromosomal replication initiator protein DnaA [Archangium sp.]|nr:chromosomal replication initiator protein DnaA [Archangium sp.]
MADLTPGAKELWQSALERLRNDGQTYVVSQLLQLHPLKLEADALTLGVEDLFFRDWVDDHYSELMGTALAGVTGAPVRVLWEKVEKSSIAPVFTQTTPPPIASLRRPARLNERFTFETYVVSDSNQLPAAAAYAVSESPGRAYNPLFIYGGTGLGKTHLLHAIGNRIISRQAGARVLYLSSEEFTNQFIESVRDQKMTEFRRRFREECDVLLIDDIQFLGKKQETQNEFFYTFNALHQMSKAVVMTSDTVPSEIPGLEDRLRSRFAMGLITDVHEPTFEARMAILKKKAAAEGVNLTDKVTNFIARHVVKNVRELEGALIKVTAVHALTGQPLTEELCAQVLADLIPAQKALDAETIQREVARFYKLPVDELRGERRVKHVAHARQVAMYLCRTLTAASLPEIGKRFNKDHSTVLTSVRKIESLKDSDEQLKLELGELSQKLATV